MRDKCKFVALGYPVQMPVGLCPCGRRAKLYVGRCLRCLGRRRFGDYVYAAGEPLYHGTHHDFDRPKLNARGILWLTPNPVVATEYGSPHYVKMATAFLWTIRLKRGAKIVDLADLSQPAIRGLFDNQNVRKEFTSPFGTWSEDYWRKHADFGLLEERGAVAFLKRKRIDGVTSRDNLSTVGIPHDSVALLRLGAIESMDKSTVPRGGAERTIGEIQRAIEEWVAPSSAFR